MTRMISPMGSRAGLALGAISRPFNPISLFASGEKGIWFDPGDLSTLFQDTAGTTPVTATGQSVARINDKSGNGLNATQATAGQRPTLQQDATGRYYLSFDGVDDGLSTASVTPGSASAQLFAGVRKASDSAFQSIVELSANADANTGSLCFGCGTTTGDASRRTWASVLTGSVNLLGGAGVYAQPDIRVAALLFDISQANAVNENIMRLNGVQQSLTLSGANAGTGTFNAYPIYIGRRGGNASPFNGRLYGTVLRFGSPLASDVVSKCESWMNQRTGAY